MVTCEQSQIIFLFRLRNYQCLGEHSWSKPQKLGIVWKSKFHCFLTRGNILFINCNYCQTEDCCRFDPTKSGCRKARLDLEKLDPDDLVTPMVIAAKNGHRELFQLFKDWKGGQLLTTEVKIAQLYYMMETEDNSKTGKQRLLSMWLMESSGWGSFSPGLKINSCKP